MHTVVFNCILYYSAVTTVKICNSYISRTNILSGLNTQEALSTGHVNTTTVTIKGAMKITFKNRCSNKLQKNTQRLQKYMLLLYFVINARIRARGLESIKIMSNNK